MKNNIIQKQKEKLLIEKKNLEKILVSFAKKNKKLRDDWSTKFPYFGEETSGKEKSEDEVEEYHNLLSVEHRLELKLLDVKRALEKIEKNKGYGVCEKCGRKINKRRLEVIPEAKFCSRCV